MLYDSIFMYFYKKMTLHTSEKTSLGIDIGGTTIAGAPVSAQGEILADTLEITSPSAETSARIITELARLIYNIRFSIDSEDISACGISMPGPFDYKNGVSHMTHKFQNINGLPLGEFLSQITDLEIYWINDGDAFGLGAASWVLKSIHHARKIIGVTIGTGLGASFVEDGRIINDARVPEGGEIWNIPYDGNILENYVSGPAISSMYETKTGRKFDAKEIAILARNGDKDAINCYVAMGTIFGQHVESLNVGFKADAVVIGGNVAQSFDLFAPSAQNETHISIVQAPLENLAIKGSARYALMCQKSI
jgi:glucokinase